MGMRIGILAEGFADAHVIRAIVKKLLGSEGIEFKVLRPEEAFDETDLQAMNFSNWQLVFESCKDEVLLGTFFDGIEGEAMMIVHVDTAEREMEGYDIHEPVRTRGVDYSDYSVVLRENVKRKVESLIPDPYRDRIAYAIAIEETDAWLIPLFENKKADTASHVRSKETLQFLIGTDQKRKKAFVDTSRNSLNYLMLGKALSKSLAKCRGKNMSLDLFCLEIEQINPSALL